MTTFGAIPTLETPRLVLRRLALADEPDVLGFASDPEVARHTSGPPFTPESTIAYLQSMLARYDAQEPASWAIVRRESNQLIGTCGFVSWNSLFRRAEIGFQLKRSEWGKGLMTEAVQRALEFGFQVKGLYRIEASCMVNNLASVRVLEKAGMRFEGELRGYKFKQGEPLDMKLFAILATDKR